VAGTPSATADRQVAPRDIAAELMAALISDNADPPTSRDNGAGDVADEDRHEPVGAGRLRAELTISELWPRYVVLGGTGDLSTSTPTSAGC
jgi:hypothetical protein